MTTRPPAALVLDLYGTLLDWTQVANALGGVVAEPCRFTALWRQKQLEYTWLATVAERFEPLPEITLRALRFTAAAWETEIPERLMHDLVAAWDALPPYVDAREAIARLARSAPLIALTNGADAGSRKALEHAGLLRHFGHVLTAEHARAYKPSPKVYDLAVSIAGVARGEILYVTGQGWDAAGAQIFGFRVCRVDRKNEPIERLAGRPELTVRSLSEVAERLGSPVVAHAAHTR